MFRIIFRMTQEDRRKGSRPYARAEDEVVLNCMAAVGPVSEPCARRLLHVGSSQAFSCHQTVAQIKHLAGSTPDGV